ncbi:hypothetical protein HZS_2248 [Henneguya salminicola]|nr:hypothetical protein HZS_2248 [Henneguya salminicola]
MGENVKIFAKQFIINIYCWRACVIKMDGFNFSENNLSFCMDNIFNPENLIDIICELKKNDPNDMRIDELMADIEEIDLVTRDLTRSSQAYHQLTASLKHNTFKTKEEFLEEYKRINMTIRSPGHKNSLLKKVKEKLKNTEHTKPQIDDDLIISEEKISLKCPITQVKRLLKI